MEKTNKINNILAAAEAILGIFMILIVKVIAPVCSGTVELASGKQMPMKCHYTGVVLLFLGILMLINAVALFVTKEAFACGIMTVALSAFVFVVLSGSVGIGVCMKVMACHTTAAFARVAGAIGIVIGAVLIWSGVKERKAK